MMGWTEREMFEDNTIDFLTELVGEYNRQNKSNG
jgi:hypothetical protein